MRDIEVRQLAPGAAALTELAAFIAALNADCAHHVGYLGTDAADIVATLADLDQPAHETFWTAREGGTLVGVLGFEADEELSRAWLFGPFVRHSDWDGVADALWVAVAAPIPGRAALLELFCNAGNTNGRRFALRHGFRLHSDAAILEIHRANAAAIPPSQAIELQPAQHAAFVALYEALFPNTYYSGARIIGRFNPTRRVFVAIEEGVLVGYVYAEAFEEGREGVIEFVGVAEHARGRGHGRQLVAAALGWLFTLSYVARVHLTTEAENNAALRLYAGQGFTTQHGMRGYRRQL